MRRFHDEDLTGAEFRECDLSRARMVGVVMQDAEIDGLVTNLVVNGVEVMSYVEAELDRRHPVRLLIRSDQPDDLREAWRQLRDDWATTTERVRSMPDNSEHHGVDGEWSMVETLRHLSSCTTLGSDAACSGSPSRSRPWDWVHRSSWTGRTGSTRPPNRASTRCSPYESGRLQRSRHGWPRSRLISSRRPRRSRTTTDGPRTPRGAQCGSASALCSTRNGNTTVSACAT